MGSPKAKKPRRAPKSKASAAVPPSGAMFLGSNVHYDDQGRLLCSASSKLCNSRPVVGWGFCKTHILEDKNAPFKQCEATAKGRQCTLVVAIGENSRYCGIHMSMERKAAANNAAPSSSSPAAPEQVSSASAQPVIAFKKEQRPKTMAFLEMDYDGNVETEGEEEDAAYTSFQSSSSSSLWHSSFDSPVLMLRKLFPTLASHTALGAHLHSSNALSPFNKHSSQQGIQSSTLPLSSASRSSSDSSLLPSNMELGSPSFSLSSFLEHRSAVLLKNVRFNRMRMIHLQLAYDKYVMEEARERAKTEAFLQNEESCREIDHQRKLRTLEKLYRRKHEEEQRRKEGGFTEEGGLSFPSHGHSHGFDMDFASSASSPRGSSHHHHHHHHQTPSSHRSSHHPSSSSNASPAAGAGMLTSPEGIPRGKIEKIGKCEAKECVESALPLSSFCWAHILQDPLQKLFVPCSFNPALTPLPESLTSAGIVMAPCSYPVIRGGPSSLCAFHSSLIHDAADDAGDDAEEDEE